MCIATMCILLLTLFLGWPVTEDQLKDVAELSGVLELDDDFIESEYREKCERIIPFPGDVEPDQCADAYVYLKDNLLNS